MNANVLFTLALNVVVVGRHADGEYRKDGLRVIFGAWTARSLKLFRCRCLKQRWPEEVVRNELRDAFTALYVDQLPGSRDEIH
jgi:hypothetical protein